MLQKEPAYGRSQNCKCGKVPLFQFYLIYRSFSREVARKDTTKSQSTFELDPSSVTLHFTDEETRIIEF